MNTVLFRTLVLSSLPALVFACGSPGPEPAPEPAATDAAGPFQLQGTAWQLVKIASMDDSVYEPDERANYTLAFEPEGRLLVRADCNRGQGSWTQTGSSGLELGPLATTRAMCPEGSLHDRYLRDLSYVRSFVTKDGNIHLATQADGAILEFEPLAAKEEAP